MKRGLTRKGKGKPEKNEGRESKERGINPCCVIISPRHWELKYPMFRSGASKGKGPFIVPSAAVARISLPPFIPTNQIPHSHAIKGELKLETETLPAARSPQPADSPTAVRAPPL
ncbi:hypothetical protein B0T26DRAFT_700792, partial [Lasiosphaeria miniovina]